MIQQVTKKFFIIAFIALAFVSDSLANKDESFTVASVGDGKMYAYIVEKDPWAGEGLRGYIVTTEDRYSYEDGSKSLTHQRFSVTCNFPSVFRHTTDPIEAVNELIDTDNILEEDFFPGMGATYYHDLWWATCRNKNHKYTERLK